MALKLRLGPVVTSTPGQLRCAAQSEQWQSKVRILSPHLGVALHTMFKRYGNPSIVLLSVLHAPLAVLAHQ